MHAQLDIHQHVWAEPLLAERLAARGGPPVDLRDRSIHYDMSSYAREDGERQCAARQRRSSRPGAREGCVSLTIAELERFAAGLAAAPEHWQHLVRHSDDVRVYELIWDDEDVNAWVICWSEDQDTGFHDHDESAAAIAVISGQVREERLRLGASPQVRTIRGGSTFTVEPVAIHRVLHSGDLPAVTIHAYSPPLTRTGAYRIGTRGELEREALTIEHELRPAAVLS